MNNCGSLPLFLNCQIKNIDAVDVAATNISCTNLTVAGEPVSTILQNIGESSVGETVFTGDVEADSFTTTGAVTASSVTSGTTNAGALTCSSFSTSGSIAALSIGVSTAVTGATVAATGAITGASVTATGAVTGNSLVGTVTTATQNVITKIGTQTSFATSGNITQSGGTATLKALTADSLTTAGNITQTGAAATATLKALTADSLATAGNITQTGAAATATLKAVTANSLTTTGNVTVGGSTSTKGITNTTTGFTDGLRLVNTSGTSLLNLWSDGSNNFYNSTVGSHIFQNSGSYVFQLHNNPGNGIVNYERVYMNKQLNVTGTTTLGDATVGGTLSVTGGTTLNGALTTTGDVTVATNLLVTSTATGRVGILNTNPQTALHVNGQITATGIKADSIQGQLSGNTINIGFNSLYVDGTTKFVGVNKAVPTVPLDVTGAMAVSGNITQTGTSTATLKATTADSLTTTGNVTVGGNLSVTGLLLTSLSPTIYNMSSFTQGSAGATQTLTGINTSTVSAVRIYIQDAGLSLNAKMLINVIGATVQQGQATSANNPDQIYETDSNTRIPIHSNNLRNNEAVFGEIKFTRVYKSSAKTTWVWVVTGNVNANGGADGHGNQTTSTVGGYFTNATNNLTFTQLRWDSSASTSVYNRGGSTVQYEYDN